MRRTISLASLLFLAACSSAPVPNLDSKDPYERYLGALEASEESDAESLKRIEALLKDPDPLARTGAVVALTKRQPRPPGALAQLIGMLGDADSSVRIEAIRSLADFKEPSSVEPIVKVLAFDAAVEARRVAALELGVFPDSPSLRTALLEAFSDPAAGVAYNAHRSLVRLTGRKDLPRARAAAEEALKKS